MAVAEEGAVTRPTFPFPEGTRQQGRPWALRRGRAGWTIYV